MNSRTKIKLKFTIFHIILLLEVVAARYAFVPRFFAQDSAIIVDTDKTPITTQQVQKSHRMPYYPIYHIIPKVNPSKNSKENYESVQSTITNAPNVSAPSVILTKDEFPKDLLDIAQNKLGINNLDEVPSISELGELLGTESAEETLKYIREITATEEGIALVKAYIESSDYTDSTGITTKPSTTDYSTSTNTETASEFESASPSFFDRLSAYFNIFDFFLTRKKVDLEKNFQPQFNSITTPSSVRKPLLVRYPLPYHYPVPLRPMVIYKSKNVPTNIFQSIGYINTPKLHKQLFKTAANLATKSPKFKNLLQQKNQQLNLLADNVNKIPSTHNPTYNRITLNYDQYEAAIEQDEDLKKIISSKNTLK